MGSVIPLIAIAEQLKQKQPNINCLWIGTKSGPEQPVVRNYNIDFKAIPSGKWRRYFDPQNFIDIVKIIAGFFISLFVLKKYKPDMIISAGGFVAVPVVWAGWLLAVPSLIHQQDVRPGLANKLCAWCAGKITVCFPESAKYFNHKKTAVVGNPVRGSLKNLNTKTLNHLSTKTLNHSNTEALDHSDVKEHGQLKLDTNSKWPVVLITGGGRGALKINEIAEESLSELTKFCQIIHITGKNKKQETGNRKQAIKNYHQFDFLIDTAPALLAADLVVSRAGMGTLTEIAFLGKPAIIIPIPNSQQADNAKYFLNKQAVEVLDQSELDTDIFVSKIKSLLNDPAKMKQLSENINQSIQWGAEIKMAEMVLG